MARKVAEEASFTEEGVAEIADSKTRFGVLMETQAAYEARRRGAKAIDNTDAEAAYRHLLSPRSRPIAIDITTEVGLVVSGALIGYGVTIVTGAGAGSSAGYVILAAGAFIVAISSVFKHIPWR